MKKIEFNSSIAEKANEIIKNDDFLSNEINSMTTSIHFVEDDEAIDAIIEALEENGIIIDDYSIENF